VDFTTTAGKPARSKRFLIMLIVFSPGGRVLISAKNTSAIALSELSAIKITDLFMEYPES
jgi:hypothetical protein